MTVHLPSPPHPASIDPDRLLGQCQVERGRASGPGGQRRHTTETAVYLRHQPTGVEAHGDERRSQAENLHTALRRLRVSLAVLVRCPVDPAGRASAIWKSRLRGGRIELSPRHADFAPMLAEALDMLAAAHFDPAAAARALGCTPSQFIKLLKDEPRAMALLNTERSRRGLRPMK